VNILTDDSIDNVGIRYNALLTTTTQFRTYRNTKQRAGAKAVNAAPRRWGHGERYT